MCSFTYLVLFVIGKLYCLVWSFDDESKTEKSLESRKYKHCLILVLTETDLGKQVCVSPPPPPIFLFFCFLVIHIGTIQTFPFISQHSYVTNKFADRKFVDIKI